MHVHCTWHFIRPVQSGYHFLAHFSLHFAQGALVGPSPLGGGGACALAQGALVGVMGPGGRREVCGGVGAAPDESVGLPVAHGAAVGPIGGATRALDPAVAQGAWLPGSALGRAVEDDGGPASGTTGRPCGPDVV